MSKNVVRRVLMLVATTAFALVATLLPVAPASAAPGAPSSLSPDATTVEGIPILQWSRVKGADRYEVQVSASAGSTVLWKASTTNRRATPSVQLPRSVHWQVRAINSSGAGSWAQASFERQGLAGPSPQSPSDGAVLQQPQEPTLVSWEPVPGATGYTVEVGRDSQFVDAKLYKSYTTQTSSYVVPDPLVATQYYWRVRATMASGIVTDWSPVRSYTMSGLAKPVLESPADSPTTSVIDVVLDWKPVVGAKTYNLQISTDQNFNTIEHSRNGVTGTRYSPPVTLSNDQYYWRVTPVDSAGNTRDWSNVDIWTFRRHWPDQPQPEYPAGGAIVGDPFYYQWAPARHASSYRLELSTSPDFSIIADSCTTVQTTFTPTKNGDCFPAALGTYYWRVLAFDAPENQVSDAVQAVVRRFTYDPAMVQLSAPANGETVQVPTLTWQPAAGAAEYQVTITQTDTGKVTSARTTGTSWTPRSLLPVDKTYRWQVQAVSQSGRLGASLLPGSQRTFSVVAMTATTTPTPEPVTPAGTTSSRFPTLQWTPVTGATKYQVLVRRQGTLGWMALVDYFAYPAGEDDTTAWLAPDTYEWHVIAYNGNNAIAQSSGSSSFVVESLERAAGQKVAITGTASDSAATSCSKKLDPALPLADQQCLDLRATPILRWNPQADAGSYVVWISRDQQLTNVIAKYPTDQSIFTPTSALFDSQAGSAFYWWVQPCKQYPNNCLAPEHAGHAFNKLSKPVQTLSPAAGATVANDVTFTWRDYLATNQDATTPGSHSGVHLVEPRVEAKTYRLQVDDDPNFQSPLETVVVDQMTYTSYATTYPEGPLYWRVQAIDGSDNPLTWSNSVAFQKRSPAVTLTAPIGGLATSGVEPLRWEPLAYAASYDVEVYRNGDTIGQSANLVLSGNSKQVAFSPAKPLVVESAAYTWRVRPRDAANRPGQWTNLAAPSARFRVTGTPPTQTAPAPGQLLVNNDALFTWTAVDHARDYRFERRLVGSSTVTETQITAALAWAPTATIADGRWEWRVVSRDSAGKDIGASPWSGFVVDGTRPTVTAYNPQGMAKRRANFKVKFSEPTVNVRNTTFKLFMKGSRKPLSAVVKPSSDRRRAVLNPARNLKRGKLYILKVTPKIKDDAGNRLVPHKWKVRAK